MAYRICLEKQAIRDYLKEYGKGPYTQDDDLMLGLAIARFHEHVIGGEFLVCLELKDSYANEYGVKKKMGVDEIRKYLQERLEKKTPIDFTILRKQKVNGSFQKLDFQLKRVLSKGGASPTTGTIISLIDKVNKKYQKSEVLLIIAIETDQEINFPKVQKHINKVGVPFKRVMFFAKSEDNYLVGEIWPGGGWNPYKLSELV